MNIRECYDYIGGNYENAMLRMKKEERLIKYAKMFDRDPNYNGLVKALDAEDYDEAFRKAHTLKSLCQNLEFTTMSKPCVAITETLRLPVRNIKLARELLPDITKNYEHLLEGIHMLD